MAIMKLARIAGATFLGTLLAEATANATDYE